MLKLLEFCFVESIPNGAGGPHPTSWGFPCPLSKLALSCHPEPAEGLSKDGKGCLLRQILMRGRAEDIRALELDEIRQAIDRLDLPKEIESLWRRYLEYLNAQGI